MMRRPAVVPLIAALAVACQQTPRTVFEGTDSALAIPRSSSAKDSVILQKDSLLRVRERQLSLQSQLIGDAATSARLVSEIDRELSRVRVSVPPDTAAAESAIQNMSQQLDVVQRKVNAVIARLNASEARLRRMRSDSVAHAAFDSTQAAQLREYAQSIADLRASVEQQRMEITLLTQRVDSLTRVTVVLAAVNDSMAAMNIAMAAHQDSVFVAIGTERELTELGVVRREGGTLLLFGRGKTLVPGRSPQPGAFRVLSMARDITIPLPRTDKDYRVVSRQNLEYTDLAKPQDATVRGELHITDPDRFWAPSKYLILVQK